MRSFADPADYKTMCAQVGTAFDRADMPEVLRLLDHHLVELTYSLRSLFRDEQQRALDVIVRGALTDADALAGQLYETHSPLVRYLATLDPNTREGRWFDDFAAHYASREDAAVEVLRAQDELDRSL